MKLEALLRYLCCMNEKTALVIGATGLVGTQLVQLLINDVRFSAIKVFVRRTTGISHPKFEEHIIDFERQDQWEHLVKGDVLFSALGTTIGKAGSKKAQYLIDYHYQYNFAKAASYNGVPVYVLVSSAMANPNSGIFYTRMKGELERDIRKLQFGNIHMLRPGMLAGDRKEERWGEKVGIAVIRFLNQFGIARKHKPVDAIVVAQAMINLSFRKENHVNVVSLLEVFHAAGLPA